MSREFEEKLLNKLNAVVEENEAKPARRFGMVPRLATGGAVLAVAGGITFGLMAPSAAYAITEEEDGVIAVEVEDISDPEGLEQELAEYGVKSDFANVPAGKTCGEGWYDREDTLPTDAVKMGGHSNGDDGPQISFRIDLDEWNKEGTLLVETSDEEPTDNPEFSSVEQNFDVAKGEVDDCDVVDG